MATKDRPPAMERRIDSFINEITKMTKKSFLLVEGGDDVAFFSCLTSDRSGNGNIEVWTANKLKENRRENNKEKILQVEEEIRQDDKISSRFLAFIDRDYENFCDDGDTLHYPPIKQRDRVVRTRGHSIENYFFEFIVMRDQLLKYHGKEAPEYTIDALKSMEQHFSEIIRIACALSLAAKDSQLITRLRNTLEELGKCIGIRDDWMVIDYDESSELPVTLDKEGLVHHLQRLDANNSLGGRVQWFIDDFDYFMDRLKEQRDEYLPGLLCHGHIGFALVRHAYAVFLCHLGAQAHNPSDDPYSDIRAMLSSHWLDRNRDRRNGWTWHFRAQAAEDFEPEHCLEQLGLVPTEGRS